MRFFHRSTFLQTVDDALSRAGSRQRISSPEDAQYILSHTKGVHGFYGASSAERMPVEVAITEHIRKFKSITF